MVWFDATPQNDLAPGSILRFRSSTAFRTRVSPYNHTPLHRTIRFFARCMPHRLWFTVDALPPACLCCATLFVRSSRTTTGLPPGYTLDSGFFTGTTQFWILPPHLRIRGFRTPPSSTMPRGTMPGWFRHSASCDYTTVYRFCFPSSCPLDGRL